MTEALAKGEPLPVDWQDQIVYYLGPTPAKPGDPIGSAGPTTSGRMDAYTATETSWRGGELAPFVPWLDRGQWWVGEHLGALLLVGVLTTAVVVLGAPSLRRLGPGPWFWCIGYVVYLLAFFDPTTSVFRILLPLAPAAWALASCLSTRRRVLLLTACAVGQLFWISWVWDLSVRVTQWVP